jgi:hypothetical protein
VGLRVVVTCSGDSEVYTATIFRMNEMISVNYEIAWGKGRFEGVRPITATEDGKRG